MIDYAAVKDELSQPAYAGLSNAAAADALNARIIPAIRDVPTIEAANILRVSGRWGVLALAARQVVPLTDPMAPLVTLAITVTDTLRDTTALGVTNPAHWSAMQDMVAGMVAAGLISQQVADDLLALRNTMTSRREQLGLPELSAADIQTARLV